MRRFIAILTVLFACLFGLPATASAAPAPIGGGSILFNPVGSGNQCVVAFAASGGDREYLIAGPGCDTTMSTQLYSGDNVPVGPVVGGLNHGYVVVAVTNTDAWDVVGWINAPGGKYSIAGSVETPVGGRVCLLSHTAGITCGTVTAKNVTISYPEGTISGLTQTNICPQPRSIAYVTGDQAQGVPLGGGSGICTTAGNSYFFPVNRILSAYGLALLTG
ncbi:MAG: S1 family peptidase [Actinophytocola sp.]|uniref:S1 family peptidase n=1 Tax=Actinophytocola sp. TaxID=1872138 RepID=UPI003C74FD4B